MKNLALSVRRPQLERQRNPAAAQAGFECVLSLSKGPLPSCNGTTRLFILKNILDCSGRIKIKTGTYEVTVSALLVLALKWKKS